MGQPNVKAPLEPALAVLSELEHSGILGRFAIGGAMAAMFYAEPVLTYDLNIFVALPEKGALVTLTPLYEALRRRGYMPSGECVDIEGIPVQFLPAATPLLEDALSSATELPYGSAIARVMRVEHLIAICLQTGRPKDRERVRVLLAESQVDRKCLMAIVDRFGLRDRWDAWTA
jgi:hypothetical protein